MPQAPMQGLAKLMAMKGRGGDTMLAHINPMEAKMLEAMGGSGTINPSTGLREFYSTPGVGNVGGGDGYAESGVSTEGSYDGSGNYGGGEEADQDPGPGEQGTEMPDRDSSSIVGAKDIGDGTYFHSDHPTINAGVGVSKGYGWDSKGKPLGHGGTEYGIKGALAMMGSKVLGTLLGGPIGLGVSFGGKALAGNDISFKTDAQLQQDKDLRDSGNQHSGEDGPEDNLSEEERWRNWYNQQKASEPSNNDPVTEPTPEATRTGIDQIHEVLTQEEILNAALGRDEPIRYFEDYKPYSVNTAAHGGGLHTAYRSAGGNFEEFAGLVDGPGDGMSDEVPFKVNGGPDDPDMALLSPDEYVVDAATMSMLGNGSPKAGAKLMDGWREGVRKDATGSTKQPKQLDGLAQLAKIGR